MLKKQGLLNGLLTILVVFFAASCNQLSESSTKSPSEDAETVKISELEPGPIRHEQLTGEQLVRIRKIHEMFQEVNGISLDETIENFKRDVNPEKEIEIWEKIAEAYTGYCSGRTLTLEKKKIVYEILLLRSLAPEEYVLENLKSNLLSPEEAKEVMSHYQGEPEPIEIDKN